MPLSNTPCTGGVDAVRVQAVHAYPLHLVLLVKRADCATFTSRHTNILTNYYSRRRLSWRRTGILLFREEWAVSETAGLVIVMFVPVRTNWGAKSQWRTSYSSDFGLQILTKIPPIQ